MYVVKNPHTSSLKYRLFFPGVKTFQLENLEKGVILTWLLGLNSDFLPTRSVIWFMYRNKLRELSRCTVHFGEVFFFKLRHLKIKWKETWQTWKLRGNKALQGHHEHKTHAHECGPVHNPSLWSGIWWPDPPVVVTHGTMNSWCTWSQTPYLGP